VKKEKIGIFRCRETIVIATAGQKGCPTMRREMTIAADIPDCSKQAKRS
jgi:hypothetical protein